MAQSTWYPGGTVPLGTTFDVNGVATDPSTVTLRIRNAQGTIATAVYGVDVLLLKSSAGVYTYNLAIPRTSASVGVWTVEWEGTGTVAQVNIQTFEVSSSALVS